MNRLVPLPLLLVASLLHGCFSPEERAASDECAPVDDLCEVNGDCCAFDGSTRSGAGLCVNFGEYPECTSVCYGDGDCNAGCCGALEGNAEYGACGPCNADPFVPASADVSSEACFEGVAEFCACGDALDVPCGDSRATFEQSCTTGSSPANVFACWAEYADQGCSVALEACPSGTVVEDLPR